MLYVRLSYVSLTATVLALLLNIGFAFLCPGLAASSVERIALQLSGPLCAAQHAGILSVLSPLPGVRTVDLSSVPDHALVDIDREVLSAQNVVEIVRRLWHDEAACLVESMQSCISADPLGHVGVASAAGSK